MLTTDLENKFEHVWANQNKTTSQIWPWDTSVWLLVKKPEKNPSKAQKNRWHSEQTEGYVTREIQSLFTTNLWNMGSSAMCICLFTVTGECMLLLDLFNINLKLL